MLNEIYIYIHTYIDSMLISMFRYFLDAVQFLGAEMLVKEATRPLITGVHSGSHLVLYNGKFL